MKHNLSLFQILVLCGDRDTKHTKILAEMTGKPENTISAWSTRGIPYGYWNAVKRLSGCSIDQIAHAHAHAMSDTTYHEEIRRFINAEPLDLVDNG